MKAGQAKRLVLARLASGFRSASEAADRYHWPRGTYLGHENGSRGLGCVVERYARAFEVSVAWLLTGEGCGPSRDNAMGNFEKTAAMGNAYFRLYMGGVHSVTEEDLRRVMQAQNEFDAVINDIRASKEAG